MPVGNVEAKFTIAQRFAGNAELTLGYDLMKGTVRFVDSNVSGGASGNGLSWAAAYLTIDEAINGSVTDDVVLVAPNHTETISAAGGIDCDVAGLSIIGLGTGSRRPIITMDTGTTTDIDIDAAGVVLENLHFKSGFADIAVCLDVNATDFTCRSCQFTEDADDENFLVCIQDATGATSDRITVEDCYCLQDDASNTHFINFAGTGKGHIVRRNVLIGDWGTMCIGGAGVVIFGLVVDNDIHNVASDADSCISLAGTGIAARNFCGGAHATQGITGTLWSLTENYYHIHTEDTQGILEPAAT